MLTNVGLHLKFYITLYFNLKKKNTFEILFKNPYYNFFQFMERSLQIKNLRYKKQLLFNV